MRAVVLGLALVFCLAPRAEAGACPAPSRRPAVSVAPLLPSVPETHSASYRELSTMLTRALKPNQDVLGLSSARFGEKYSLETRMVKRGSRNCYYLAALRVEFGYTERLVQIAREVPEGSCMFKEIRGHEYRHVAVDDAVVRDNLAYVAAELQRFADGLGAIEAANDHDAEGIIGNALDKAMKPVVAHASKLEDAAQDKVDTDAEYARVEDACRAHIDPSKLAATTPMERPEPDLAPGGK